MATQEASPLELRQYLEILKRHKWFILEAVVIVSLAAGILSSIRTPVYKATARVLLTPNDPNQQLNPTSAIGVTGADADRYIAGQITIAESEAVAQEASKQLQGVEASALERKTSVSQDGQSSVLNISAVDTDPVQAREMADAVAKGYIENRRKAAVSGLQGAADDVQAKLGPLQSQIAQLDGQIGDGSSVAGATSSLVSPVNPTSNSAPSPGATQATTAGLGGLGGAPSTQEALKAARYAAAVQYETLYARQQELLVDISLKRGDAELIAAAKTPLGALSPHPKRDAALGALVGVLLAICISILREQLNDRIRTTEEAERLAHLPLLAQLPYDDEAAGNAIAIEARPNSGLSEAIRSLRTSIQYQSVDQPVRVIVVTSPLPGEGKSLVAANLAAAFAQANYRAILISADLRRPSLDGLFPSSDGSRNTHGLSSLVLPDQVPNGKTGSENGHAPGGETRIAEAVVRTSTPGLLFLPSGPKPPNPAELLGSRRMSTILAHLSESADVVVIDSPPLLPVTDAAVLAAKSDGIVLVAAANETKRDSLRRACAILEGTGGRVLGIVLNKSPRSGGYYYDGYYGGNGQPSKSAGSAGVSSRRKASIPAAGNSSADRAIQHGSNRRARKIAKP